MKWLLLLIPLGWIVICSLVYGYLLYRWLKTESFGAHAGLALLAAFFFAPGLIVAHGAAPFPAGIAFLAQIGAGSMDVINLACWLITAAAFAAVGRRSVRIANAERA